jgi:hypothetical protein
MDNLGKSKLEREAPVGAQTVLLDARTRTLDAVQGNTVSETVEMKTAGETVLMPGVPGDKTVVESEIDDKTRFETVVMDNTVLETDADKTVMDEGVKRPSTLPLIFGWLVFLGKDGTPVRDVRINREKSMIGKGGEADIRLQDDYASKLHALIHYDQGRFTLSDLGSTNHTWLNDKKITSEELNDGDTIRIGHQRMLFKRVRRPL